ncbi:MAG: nicotinamide-nucleotide amidohydrolase family protein [Candidatus Omnitrophota bacterium]|nr:nicotinamide-nucleotide amidohydrolase family protein [Candidatus Omnitrophota bacterium]
MKPILKQIHALLIRNQLTLAVAESCTGGLLSKLLTDLPGSSRYFLLGIAAYSNSAKKKLLKIPVALLAKKGAVSQEAAAALAANIRGIANADLGIGITGIAGPEGGTARKPVGTVFISVANRRKVICEEFRFSGSRSAVRKKAALKAIELLKESIIEKRANLPHIYHSSEA